jgi:hypothetical protein
MLLRVNAERKVTAKRMTADWQSSSVECMCKYGCNLYDSTYLQRRADKGPHKISGLSFQIRIDVKLIWAVNGAKSEMACPVRVNDFQRLIRTVVEMLAPTGTTHR